MNERILLALRYDDFSNGSPDDLDRFVLGAAAAAGVALTVAAVPFGPGPDESRTPDAPRDGDLERPLTAAKARLLVPHLDSGAVELAQHGYDHRPAGADPRGRPAEFYGQSPGEQRARIERGARLLEAVTGTRPRTFVPPWNRYDATTARVLVELGFQTLSAGREGGVPGLITLPATLPAAELEGAIREADEADAARVLIALLHPYDFFELGRPWGRMSREAWVGLLARVGAHPEVRCVTLGRLGSRVPDLDGRRMRAFARFHASPARRMVPPSVSGSLDRPLTHYPAAAETRVLSQRRAAIALGIFGSIAVAAGIVGLGLALVAGRLGHVPLLALRLVGAVGTGLLVVRTMRGEGPYFRGLASSWGAACGTAASWLA